MKSTCQTKPVRHFATGGALDPNGYMDSTERDNMEKTKRWAMDGVAEKLKYANGPEANALSKQYGEQAKDYNAFTTGVQYNPNAQQQQQQPLVQPAGSMSLSGMVKPVRSAAPAVAASTTPSGGSYTLDSKPGQVFNDALGRMGFANGGKIKGPGTSTSDSIQGQVKETGEPIKVSTNERIVSAKQDAVLQRIAEMLGFESVDAMFEQMTGQPVGPTVKGGQRAAVFGWGLGRGMAMGTPRSDTELAAERDAAQQSADAPQAVPENIQSDRKVLAQGAGALADVVTLPGRAIADGVGFAGNQVLRVANAVAGKELAAPYQSSIGQFGATPFYDAAVGAKPAATQQPSAAPAAQATTTQPAAATPTATQHGAALLGDAPANSTGNAPPQPVGIVKFADPKGKLFDEYAGLGMNTAKLSNGKSAILGQSAADAATDARFAAAGAKKDAYGNWISPTLEADKQRLAQMQTDRITRDAFDPSITDMGVKANALMQLQHMNNTAKAGAENRFNNARGQNAESEAAQNAQMLELRTKAIAGDQQAIKTIQAVMGKSPHDIEGKVAYREEPDPNNPGQMIKTPFLVRGDSEREIGAKVKPMQKPTYEQFAAQMKQRHGDKATDAALKEAYAKQFGAK